MSNDKNQQTLIARVIIRHGGKVLVLRRAEGMDRAGFWELPGGHVELGETAEQAAQRETKEETGLNLDSLEFHHTSSYNYKDKPRLSIAFTGRTDSRDVKLSPEHDEFDWVDSSNYRNKNFEESYLRLLDELFSQSVSSEESDDKNTTDTQVKLKIHSDGGSRGNPGPSASGYVISTEDDNVLEAGGEYLGITTNNQAEYQAVELGLQRAAKYRPKTIEFFIDSELVVKQMNGEYKIKNRDLWPIHARIKELASGYDKVTFIHVKREYNKLADDEVNKILDAKEA